MRQLLQPDKVTQSSSVVYCYLQQYRGVGSHDKNIRRTLSKQHIKAVKVMLYCAGKCGLDGKLPFECYRIDSKHCFIAL